MNASNRTSGQKAIGRDMELHCRECGTTVTPHTRYEDRQLAKCRECGAVFKYAERPADETGGEHERSFSAAGFPVPPGITVEQRADGLQIVRRWRSKAAIGLAVFCVLWDAGIVYMLFYWCRDAVFFCFTLPFILFAVLITYFMFCLFLNRTVIETSRGVLSVRHRPLPWPGKHVALIDVDHVYCEEHVSHSDESTTYDYLLKAVTGDGKRIKLLSVREGPEQVLFVAQVINDWLRVADRPKHRQAPQ